MQIANALNNTIRILFNPRVETFRMFDFLIVKSNEDRYLAQIIEIYDDKFDASQNVAKLKLFYKITETNEVMAYDNFTPNKECEIVKINQDEVENFINQDKKTFAFATNVKNKSPLNIQYDFFNRNAIILADKIENTCIITPNLAKNLSTEKPVIIIDSTGVIEYEDAKKIKASKNFRLPLNDSTIDYIFENCLSDASLEFQAIGGEIINEIKKYAKKQEQGFIPFNAFTRVILEQYKATPYAELRLLLMRLKKLQMDEIFAKTKKDKETLFKTIEKSAVTIFDISTLDSIWQKAYIDYFIYELKTDAYVITRVNDENFDVDLINKIYNEKRNIKFIPNASYAYKKLPSIMQYCKNYILMPSLYQRMDFLDANFALSNLISDGCILFGENTDNFLYLANDYGLEIQEKRKNYRKIALSLVQNEKNNEELKESVYETKFDDSFDTAFSAALEQQSEQPQERQENLTDSQKLIDELSDFETQQKQQIDEFEEIEDTKNTQNQENKEPQEENFTDNFIETNEDIDDFFDEKENIEAIEENSHIDEVFSSIAEEKEVLEAEAEPGLQSEKTEEIFKPETKVQEEKPQQEEDKAAREEHEPNQAPSEPFAEHKDEIIIKKASNTSYKNIDIKNADIIDPDEQFKDEKFDSAQYKDPYYIQREAKSSKTDVKSHEEILKDVEDVSFSDEELDFFQMAKESVTEEDIKETSIEPIKEENITLNEEEFKEEEQEQEEQQQEEESGQQEEEESPKTNDSEIDLNEIADKSIDRSFEQIINEKNENNQKTISIDENTKLDADILNQPAVKENLPIFKDEAPVKENTGSAYSVGDIILHKKYGRGEIVKTIKYEERQLLQIAFDESGKKLLDPKVADIKLEQ